MVFGHTSERRKSLLKEVAGIISQTQFPGYFTKLEEVSKNTGKINVLVLVVHYCLYQVFTGPRVWPISDAVLSTGSEEHSKLATSSEHSSSIKGEEWIPNCIFTFCCISELNLCRHPVYLYNLAF